MSNTASKCMTGTRNRRSVLRCGMGLLLLVCTGAALAQQASRPMIPFKEVGFDQKLDVQVPLDLPFRDEAGNTVKLGDYFGKKPVILTLVYYECPMLCTQVLNGLVTALKTLPFDAGKEYEIVTVSFNPRETSELAAAKKQGYLEEYGRPADAGWHFLTGDQESIKRLTEAVGFRYYFDERSNQYAHASGITVLTPQGKTSRYFFGINYPSRDLRFGLIDASENRIGSPVDYVLLLCFHYDPLTGQYGLVIMNVMRLAGTITVVLLGGYVLAMLARERRARRRSAAAGAPAAALDGK